MLFICSVVSHSLWPHGLQHARLLCPSPSPGVCLNSCPCHPTISSAVIPFSSCLQYFLSSRFFLVSWLFTSGGQGIGTSALASVLSMNIQSWFPLGLTGLISLPFKSLLQHHSLKALSILWCSVFFMVGFLGGSDIKSICLQYRRPEFDPWVGRSPGEGNGNPLQYSCLENSMYWGAW